MYRKIAIFFFSIVGLLGLFYSGNLDVDAREIPRDVILIQEIIPTPARSVQELIERAFPPINVKYTDMDRVVYGNDLDWPEMHYLNEGVQILGRTVTPTKFRIVPAGNTVKIYNPQNDEIGDVDIDWLNGVYQLPFPVIPPGGSLIMVHINVDPEIPESPSDPDFICDRTYSGLRGEFFWIAYPGLGEHGVEYKPMIFDPLSVIYDLGDYDAPFSNCINDGWLYFYLPTLDVDPALLWLEYIEPTGTAYSLYMDNSILAFWTLIELP